jgi:hypothetical protein
MLVEGRRVPVSFSGTMDMALGLRTMVIPTANEDSLYSYSGTDSRREWTVHLQVRCCRGACKPVLPVCCVALVKFLFTCCAGNSCAGVLHARCWGRDEGN